MRDWLKEARTKKGMTMKQVSDRLVCSESYYSLIEKGERQKPMDLAMAQKLGEIFGIPTKTIAEYENDIY